MPLITLTSDFGEDDYLAGAVKGMLFKTIPDLQLTDITHRLLPFNDHKAAHVISNTTRHFPDHTFHLIFFNLYYSKPDHLLLVYYHRQYLLLADNGLLSMLSEDIPEKIIALPLDHTRQRNILQIVEVYAQAILGIINGKNIDELGLPQFSAKSRNSLIPVTTDQYIEGQILYIDAFENVIVNIRRQEFEEQRKGRGFKIMFKRDEFIDRISETYADVPPGDKLALFNAAGYLEIAVNRGNAAGLFGLQGFTEGSNSKYAQARISYQSVRILFDS
jgi:S-adenosylmethionine hydrolase